MHHCSPCRQAVLEGIIVEKPNGYQPPQDTFVPRQVGIVPGLQEVVQAQAVRPDLVVVTQAYHLQNISILRSREGILPHNAVDNLTSISGVITISRQPANLSVCTGGKDQNTQWVHGEFIVSSETICPPHTQWVHGELF